MTKDNNPVNYSGDDKFNNIFLEEKEEKKETRVQMTNNQEPQYFPYGAPEQQMNQHQHQHQQYPMAQPIQNTNLERERILDNPNVTTYINTHLQPSSIQDININSERLNQPTVGPHDFEIDPNAPPMFDAFPSVPVVKRSVENFGVLFDDMVAVDVKKAKKDTLDVELSGDDGAMTFAIPYKQMVGKVKKLTITAPRSSKSYDQISPNSWKSIGENCLNELTHLNLHRHFIDLNIASIICDSLLNGSQALEEIDLFENHIDGTTAVFLVQQLKALPKLKVINLGENMMDASSRRTIDNIIEKTNLQIDLF